MTNKVYWDIYESALLLEAYLKIASGGNRQLLLEELSLNLRLLGQIRGADVDELYRNLNGMQWQIGFMEKAFINHKYDIRKPPQVFINICSLYKNDIDKYTDILNSVHKEIEEAKVSINKGNNSLLNHFKSWLKSQNKYSLIANNIFQLYVDVNNYSISHNISKTDFWDIVDPREYNSIRSKLSASHIFKMSNKARYANFEKFGILYSSFLVDYFKVKFLNDTKEVVPRHKKNNIDSECFTNFYSENEIDLDKIVCFFNNDKLKDLFIQIYMYLKLYKRDIVLEVINDYIGMRLTNEVFRFYVNKNYIIYFVTGTSCNISKFIEFSCENKDLIFENLKLVNRYFDKYKDKVLLDNNDNKFYIGSNKEICESVSQSDSSSELLIDDETINVELSSNSNLNDINDMESVVSRILKEHFAYGFRHESIRELMRFRQYLNECGFECLKSDDELKNFILSCGDLIDDKVFVKENNFNNDVNVLIDSIKDRNFAVIYYESLFEDEKDFVDKYHITSVEMLKDMIQKNVENFYYSKNFLSLENGNELDVVGIEIAKLWGDKAILSYEDLKLRLPYIPIQNIKRVLCYNPLFINVTDGEYFCLNKFIISDMEKANVIDKITEVFNQNGFASLVDIPIGNLEIENFELPVMSIRFAVYRTVLIDKYKLNGKILTKYDSNLDSITIVKRIFQNSDECYFDEVNDKIIELDGAVNREKTFQVLYDDFIRVDKFKYVSSNYVHFEIDEIDMLLANFYVNSFGSIKDVTTFVMFPPCGLPWNHFVLESFCYRYSKMFSLQVINFNDKNAGMIVKKTLNKSYNELLAIILAKSKIKLENDIVGTYLYENGFLARSKYAMIDELVAEAKKIREE